ncbi:MAG: hypothetical protein P1V51_00770 [Deltaproteobacteria bacterium]|nr:hypothetical protein [Deltaproteobacteria bacterium]
MSTPTNQQEAAAMAEREIRERDILVAPHEYAYVQDLTKGDIVLYVGPTKISLSNTERLVVFEEGRFVPVRGDDAARGVHEFVAASSSQYIVLENPPKQSDAAPVKGANSSAELLVGRKVIVPGPAEFPLWPGQRAKVVDGHELREDEYLVVRVYEQGEGSEPIGSEHIVRGADVAFYIPETGLEVVPLQGRYLRRAWRLQKDRGLHLRVTRPFVAAEGEAVPPGEYRAGQDLFLRDREGYFFPSESLEVVEEVSRIALAEKEGVYLRDRATGKIRCVEGPVSYLPDPTQEERVVRHLSEEKARLYGLARGGDPHAPSITIPPSTAVMVTTKDRREVVSGPQTRILAYDEELEVLTLSTGRPKQDEALLSTCFLQIEGNRVSDVVRVTTADHVKLRLTLSYRVSFTGEPERWFNVKNYVGLLCEHLGSLIRAASRNASIESFHEHGAEILRSAILGKRGEKERREGRVFEENGMWVYDVEVLEVEILDQAVRELLADAQRETIVSQIARKKEELRLGDEKLREAVSREIQAAQRETAAAALELEAARAEVARARAESAAALEGLRSRAAAEREAEALERMSAARLQAAEREGALEASLLESRTAAFREQMEAMSPQLIATLENLGARQLSAELSRNLSPLAILGGESVAEVAARLLDALPLGPGAAPAGIAEVLRLGGEGGEGA